MKEILLTSSVLIAVIMLLRWLLRGKVSQRLLYGVWLLVAVRLLIPFQFGQWALSLNTLTDSVASRSQTVQQAEELLQEPVAGPSRNEIYQQLTHDYIEQGLDPALPEVQTQLESQVREQFTAPTVSQLLTVIWIAGMVLMALWFLLTNLIFLGKAKKGAAAFAAEAPVPVRLSATVPTPCLVGLFRPVIYLTPASTQTPEMLRHVLTHELAHLRQGDHIWSLVRCVCLCIYWFNPMVWLAAAQSRRDCELSCDESALRILGDSERIPYGKTLLATVSHAPSNLLKTATSMNESKKQLRERMCFIVKKPRNLIIAVIALVLVIAVAAGCAFTGSRPPEETQPTTTEPEETTPEPTTEPTQPTESTPEPVFMKNTPQSALIGTWLAHVQISETDTFTYTMQLNEDGTMEYRWGYYGSDLLEVLEGTWKPGDDANEYILELTFTGGGRYEDNPPYDYYGIQKLRCAEDGSSIRADWGGGPQLFHFYSDTRLILYRYESDGDYYDLPVQTLASGSENMIPVTHYPNYIALYEQTPAEQVEEKYDSEEFVITKTHYQLQDELWAAGGHTYKYRLEITGRMRNAAKNTTYIVLSNTINITFEQTWKASGLSSSLSDYFDPEVAIIVGSKLFS